MLILPWIRTAGGLSQAGESDRHWLSHDKSGIVWSADVDIPAGTDRLTADKRCTTVARKTLSDSWISTHAVRFLPETSCVEMGRDLRQRELTG